MAIAGDLDIRSAGTRAIGKLGEDLAARYLNSSGYCVIFRNYRNRFGEIDIIAAKRQAIHFVEVKTRRTVACGYPAENVAGKKLRRLYNLGVLFAQERSLSPSVGLVFEIASVRLVPSGGAIVEMIPMA